RQARTRRRLRALGMDSPRLLRFHRARLRPGDACVLRTRTSVGERGANRNQRNLTANITVRGARFWVLGWVQSSTFICKRILNLEPNPELRTQNPASQHS